MPETWKEVNITLIPKQVQHLMSARNYRPISWLNNDCSLFTMTFAERLKIVLKEFNHLEFLAKRQLKDNIRTKNAYSGILKRAHQKQAALILLDAEKAFDDLNWIFLIKILMKRILERTCCC